MRPPDLTLCERLAARAEVPWGCRSGRNLDNDPRFRLRAMPPDLREGQMSVFAKRIMRKPRTLHCPYCDGKVLFTRNEEHLDAKNCPHCGMKVERREWPQAMYDPPPILRSKPGVKDKPPEKDKGP